MLIRLHSLTLFFALLKPDNLPDSFCFFGPLGEPLARTRRCSTVFICLLHACTPLFANYCSSRLDVVVSVQYFPAARAIVT